MNIYNLRYFVTLARIRQYTKAAEELCITQPSLSHAISQMEKELGVKLFEKNGHKITLTQFGEEFLSYAEKTLDVLDDGMLLLKKCNGKWNDKIRTCKTIGNKLCPSDGGSIYKEESEA
ncbi:MAG: LysR family transcriptional regulator [Eubacterium sp.]